jgi:WhiB family redox-sensing transcriptional regulator
VIDDVVHWRESPPAAVALPERSWRSEAACRSLPPELFFPAGRTGPAVDVAGAAKAVCSACPVTEDCLHYALDTNQEYGVWGGTTEDERRPLRAARRQRSDPPADAGGIGRGAAS